MDCEDINCAIIDLVFHIRKRELGGRYNKIPRNNVASTIFKKFKWEITTLITFQKRDLVKTLQYEMNTMLKRVK